MTSTLTAVHANELYTGCAAEIVKNARTSNLVAGYAPRSGGYCDGEASEQHAGTLTLQSVINGEIRFESSELEVMVNSSNYFILRGWDLRATGSYRLDGPLNTGSLNIDLDAAIHPLSMTASDLGMYAWREEGLRRIYAPVSLGYPGEITVVFRNPGLVARIRSATLCPADNLSCEIAVDNTVNNREGGDSLITLKFPSASTSGHYVLAVEVRERRPNTVSRTINLEL